MQQGATCPGSMSLGRCSGMGRVLLTCAGRHVLAPLTAGQPQNKDRTKTEQKQSYSHVVSEVLKPKVDLVVQWQVINLCGDRHGLLPVL